mmetsp:Transcript_16405/g.55369  ORF Transcript_16405/g.55369 Transcript_16405/m.55369 type:complete len:208 (+) Transcript_16405:2070-2693(+)
MTWRPTTAKTNKAHKVAVAESGSSTEASNHDADAGSRVPPAPPRFQCADMHAPTALRQPNSRSARERSRTDCSASRASAHAKSRCGSAACVASRSAFKAKSSSATPRWSETSETRAGAVFLKNESTCSSLKRGASSASRGRAPCSSASVARSSAMRAAWDHPDAFLRWRGATRRTSLGEERALMIHMASPCWKFEAVRSLKSWTIVS